MEAPGPMRRASLAFGLTAVLVGTDAVLGASALEIAGETILVAIAAVGAVVASRRPENPSGWLLTTIAVSFAAAIAASGLHEETGAVAAAWVASVVWVPGIVSVAVFPLLFPTGRPPTARWRPVLWVIALAGVLVAFGTAFEEGEFEDYAGVPNPVGVPFAGAIGILAFPALLAGAVASIAGLVVRFRRSRGVERQQLKWVAAAAVVFPFAFAAPVDDDLGFTLILLATLVIATAVAIAILRYRLYDIDVVINRALVYGALTATVAAVYLGSVLLLQLVLPARSDLAIAASTLAAAALAGPARTRIQAAVDRRFFRARYDAALALSAFAAQMRDEVSLDAVSEQLCAATTETLQPSHVSLWLR